MNTPSGFGRVLRDRAQALRGLVAFGIMLPIATTLITPNRNWIGVIIVAPVFILIAVALVIYGPDVAVDPPVTAGGRERAYERVIGRLSDFYTTSHAKAMEGVNTSLPVRIRPTRPVGSADPLAFGLEVEPIAGLGAYLIRSAPCVLLRGVGGSGKSTVMVTLALHVLDPSSSASCAPFVLDLRSWGEEDNNLEHWILRTIHAIYLIPPKDTELLFADSRLALLLDGLEEVENARRTNLLKAVAAFRNERGLVPIVLACRSGTNELPKSSLTFDAVVDLELPSGREAQAFLETLDTHVAKAALSVKNKDRVWWELVRTPLVLSMIARLGTDDTAADAILPTGNRKQRLEHLVSTYTSTMLSRKTVTYIDTESPTIRASLVWLAAKMTATGKGHLVVDRFDLRWLEEGNYSRPFYWSSFSWAPLVLLCATAALVVDRVPAFDPDANTWQVFFTLAASSTALSGLVNTLDTIRTGFIAKEINPTTAIKIRGRSAIMAALFAVAPSTAFPIIGMRINPGVQVSWWAVGATAAAAWILVGALTATTLDCDEKVGNAPLELLRISRANARRWGPPIALSVGVTALTVNSAAGKPIAGVVIAVALLIGLLPLMWSIFGGGAWVEYRAVSRTLQRRDLLPPATTLDQLLDFTTVSLVTTRYGISYKFAHESIQEFLAREGRPR